MSPCVSDSSSFICCCSLSLYFSFYSFTPLLRTRRLFLFLSPKSFFMHYFLSSNQSSHSLFSAPSLSSHTHPSCSLAAGELEGARRSQLLGSVRWLIQSPIAVSAALTNPLSAPHRLLPDPRAICLAAAFSASEPIIQLVSLCNHTLIQTDLTSAPLQCPHRLCLNLVYSMWFTQSLSVCGVE